MESLLSYVKPELLVVAIVCYFIGIGLKQSKKVSDTLIPVYIGVAGIILATLWVFATSNIGSYKDVLMALFTAIVQGALVAGLSTYVNQIIKQLGKEE